MNWTEVKPCTGGVQWEAYPSDTHAVDIWPHEKEGFSWCVITDDVDTTVPEGWSATVEDAKRHAEQAYLEWLDVTEGRKPIPDEWLDAHDETAEIVAAAVAQERAAVVAWLQRESASLMSEDAGISAYVVRTIAGAIERGEYRRGEGA